MLSILEKFSVFFALLWLLTFMGILPHWRRFFLAYAPNEEKRKIHLFLWLISVVLLFFPQCSFLASAVNLLYAHHYFIRSRWSSLLRGMGAPGAMLFWLSGAAFLLELTRVMDPDAQGFAVRILQIDFALIMLSSGVSKFSSGYLQGEGMEYGLVNPMWSYWPGFYRKFRADHWVFKGMDHAAWLAQLTAGLLLLTPNGGIWGAFLIFVGFLFIATQVRLGFLCESVMLAALLFIDPPSPNLGSVLDIPLSFYCFLRGLGLIGQWYNYFSRTSLPSFFQSALDRFASLTGLMLWRVFTVDSINFIIQVRGERDPSRFKQVAESITLASLFSTLKYQPALFEDKLRRYARTFGKNEGIISFDYLSISKIEGRFKFDLVAEYSVDLVSGAVTERVNSGALNPRIPHPSSIVHPCSAPGSYAPVRSF